jgi:formylglycine-generating enzyme required for sulfatase activity
MPVEHVTWPDAAEFCRRASEKTGRVVRLPTEAEWEYACRAGTSTEWSHGSDSAGLGEHAWYKANSRGRTHAVGQKKPNAWGLYDMHGNVWEWVADWYDAGYYASSPREDPPGPTNGTLRVVRGGTWSLDRFKCRSAFRNCDRPAYRRTNTGFRAAVSSPLK